MPTQAESQAGGQPQQREQCASVVTGPSLVQQATPAGAQNTLEVLLQTLTQEVRELRREVQTSTRKVNVLESEFKAIREDPDYGGNLDEEEEEDDDMEELGDCALDAQNPAASRRRPPSPSAPTARFPKSLRRTAGNSA